MLNPVALSIIANAFPEPRDRARAVGVWGAVAGISLAIGPVLGGALTETIGWRSVFWINLPIGLGVVILTAFFVPESKAGRPRAFDPACQACIFLALVCLVYGVIEGPRLGWTSLPICSLEVTSMLLAVAFVLHEVRSAEPLLDLRFFRSVDFTSATVLAVLVFASFASFLFLNALYLQQSRGLSALQTGLCTMPLAIAMMFSAPVSGQLVGAHGTRPPLFAAGFALTSSALILATLNNATPILLLLGAYALFGTALGMVNPVITNSAVAGMPLSQAGTAAAVASTGRQVGAALGVAICGAVVRKSHVTRNFALATHPLWIAIAVCGVSVFLLGWVSNTLWAYKSKRHVAALLTETAGS